jgi:hypothetical protein
MITCVTHKKVFTSKETAEDVLIESWTKYEYTPGNGPIAVYKCDDCGYFHLTSKGVMNEKLTSAIKEGRIKLHREAGRWLDKLKGR